jgi:hypothetical protein
MPLTDKDLSFIKAFKNLEHVNLNFSAITGSGLTELNSLKNLKSVSLSGTAVGVHDIAAPGLTSVRGTLRMEHKGIIITG